jgi:hypothetical protein
MNDLRSKWGKDCIFREDIQYSIMLMFLISILEMHIKKAGPFLVPAFTVLQSGVDLFLKLLP